MEYIVLWLFGIVLAARAAGMFDANRSPLARRVVNQKRNQKDYLNDR